jgi:leader peptidase (prepilin peptidase) / N-methyltransferase
VLSPFDLPPILQYLFAVLFGLTAGSFANAAIYRLPRPELSMTHPRRSLCPTCGYQLRWFDNLPLASWMSLAGRCRSCRSPIGWRYPLVEVILGGLFALALWLVPDQNLGLLLVWWVVLTALVIASAVDFEFFEIPDEISIGGTVLAPFICLAVPALQADTWVAQQLSGDPDSVDRFGALAGSLAGILAGGGLPLFVGWIGSRIYGRDAMGLGDVKLMAAAGGLIGPGGALAAFLVGAFFGSIAGVGGIWRFFLLLRSRQRSRGRRKSLFWTFAAARRIGRYLPFGPYLALGIGFTLVAWDDLISLLPAAP